MILLSTKLLTKLRIRRNSDPDQQSGAIRGILVNIRLCPFSHGKYREHSCVPGPG